MHISWYEAFYLATNRRNPCQHCCTKSQFDWSLSQGKPTIRYITGIKPHYVASLTTVGATNQGSLVSNLILTIRDCTHFRNTRYFCRECTVQSYCTGTRLDPNSYPQGSLASAYSLSTSGSAKFVQQYAISAGYAK